MSFRRTSNMTAETYDDDVALRAYVLRYFPHLMTPLERRVVEYTAPIISNSQETKLQSLYKYLEERDGHVEDDVVVDAFKTPYDERVANAVARVISERRSEIVENRCGECQRLARTPVAKQCFWCGHDWH